jgi:starvation-inducible DNA-binding protein
MKEKKADRASCDRVELIDPGLISCAGARQGSWPPREHLPSSATCLEPLPLSGLRPFFEGMHPMKSTDTKSAKARQKAPLSTPTDLGSAATEDVSAALNGILSDVFALYLKTKNFHWHMSGPHFRDYHFMLGEQAAQLHAMADPIAQRIRKLGGTTLRSIGHISRMQRILDNNANYVEPSDMLAELCEDNKTVAGRLREVHGVCDEHKDIGSASFIEVWIDETERRTWFLFEAGRPLDATGR